MIKVKENEQICPKKSSKQQINKKTNNGLEEGNKKQNKKLNRKKNQIYKKFKSFDKKRYNISNKYKKEINYKKIKIKSEKIKNN